MFMCIQIFILFIYIKNMNQKVIFNFLLVVFILLCLATLTKVYLKKKSVRENFFFQTATSTTASAADTSTTASAGATSTTASAGATSTTASAGATSTTLSPIMSDEAKMFQQKYMDQTNEMKMYINELKDEINNYKQGTVSLKQEVDSSKNVFDGEADKMISSLQSLGEFHDSYSQELQKALQTNLDYSDPVFQTNQEIQESRIRALEQQVSEIELLKMKVLNKQDSLLRSIICRANSTKLNVQPIMSSANPTGTFLIFINNGYLTFTENGSQVEIKVDPDADFSSNSHAFELQLINNFQEYNKAIKYEESSEKKMVLSSDDVYYPFYLVHPKGNYGKSLYIDDESYLYVDTIRLDAHCRYRTSDTFAYGSCDLA